MITRDACNMMETTKPIIDLSQLDELLKQEDLNASFSSSFNDDDDSSASSSNCSSHADETTVFFEESSSYECSDGDDMTEQEDENCMGSNGRVHFALPHNQVFPHIDRSTLTENEYHNTWYSDDEYLSFSNEIIALSIKVSRGTLICETDQQTVRGLEAKTSIESHIRHRRRRDLLHSVLGEYQRQCWQGTFDQARLCEQSKRHSVESVKEAVQRGHEDEVTVRLQWNHDEAFNDKWGSCCQKSHDSAPKMFHRRASLDPVDIVANDKKTSSIDGVSRTFSPTSTILSSIADEN